MIPAASRNPDPARYRVLVIDAHPRADSLCQGLAAAVVDGAAKSHEVRRVSLRELGFDLNHVDQPLEPALLRSREDILWAQHLVIVYPVWWGSMPALLKGWLDRVFQPGFAFAEREDGGWDGLLGGRSATLVATLDTPVWVFRWILRAPSIQALRAATLGFCGIGPVDVLLFSPVRSSTPARREQWLARARQIGPLLEHTLRTGWKARGRAWLQIMRPQFYVFPWLALTTGALAAVHLGGRPWHWGAYLLGWAAAWLLEFIAVLTNEIHDFPTDQANRNGGPFTGGSRALVQGVLSLEQVRAGRRVALGCLGLVAVAFALLAPQGVGPVLTFLAAGVTLGMGYTAPPLRLVTRGLGELNVAFTHSALVVLCGYISQGGAFNDPAPWLIAVPIFFAVLPSITLAGFPDFESDAAHGKRTLAVRFGRAAAVKFALVAAVLAAVLRLAFASQVAGLSWVDGLMLLHAGGLAVALLRYLRQPRAGRIDALLVIGLSFMVWFALAPLLQILRL